MNIFFKKQKVSCLAQVLEDGRQMADEEMKKSKYKNYHGSDVFILVKVRVQPDEVPAYEADMKASILKCVLLLPGVEVQVKYDPHHLERVELNDELQSILDRNPQLKKRS